MEESGAHTRGSKLGIFFLVLIVLTALRLLLGLVAVPTTLVVPLGVVVTAVFVAAPILALFHAAAHRWTPGLAVAFILGGAIVHAGGWLFLTKEAQSLLQQMTIAVPPLLLAGVAALIQIGLVCWCVGLGALLVTLIRDKNIIIPVAVFVAAFDIFLVLTPVGPTQAIMQARPEVFQAVAYQVPSVQTAVTGEPVAPFAFIGPADFLFCAMFFVLLFKFGMRTRQTLIALIPTLIVYLGLAYFMPLPALVPIGIVVLAINLPEFKLTRDEWLATGVVALIGVGLILWGMTRERPSPKAPPAAPSTSAPSQDGAESEGSPRPAAPGSPP